MSTAARRFGIWLVLANSWVTDAGAAAEPTARELFERGAQAYRESRHEEAVALFRRVLDLEPHAELAYNLGLAQEATGDLQGAVESFRKYLELAPDAKDRGVVETRIHNLEKRRKAMHGPVPNKPISPQQKPPLDRPAVTASTKPREPPCRAAPDKRPTVGVPTWLALRVGASSPGDALGFELARRCAENDVEDSTTQLEHQERHRTAERNRDLARLLAGIGAAATVAGGVLLYFDLSSRGERGCARRRDAKGGARVTACAPGAGALAVVGSVRF
jgi:tetratricopeptide (TPR) repeat protein